MSDKGVKGEIRKRLHTLKQVIHKLREVAVAITKGSKDATSSRPMPLTQLTSYPWGTENTYLKIYQGKLLKLLDRRTVPIGEQ